MILLMLAFAPAACTRPVAPFWSLQYFEPHSIEIGFDTSFLRAPVPTAAWKWSCAGGPSVPRSERCAFELAEALPWAEMGGSRGGLAFDIYGRRIRLDACFADDGGTTGPLGLPALLSPRPHGAAYSLESAELIHRLCHGTVNDQAGSSLEENVSVAGDLNVLHATVDVGGGQPLSGAARWPGGQPPDSAWNLGRLIALGCAYSGGGALSALPATRFASVVDALADEFQVHPPLGGPELITGDPVPPAAASREFMRLEANSHASNWWRCTPNTLGMD